MKISSVSAFLLTNLRPPFPTVSPGRGEIRLSAVQLRAADRLVHLAWLTV